MVVRRDWGRLSGRVCEIAYGERTLEGDLVAVDAVNGLLGDGSLAVDKTGSDVDALPLDGDLVLLSMRMLGGRRASGRAYVGGRVDVLDGLRDLGADTITLDQGDGVLAVVALLAGELGHTVSAGGRVRPRNGGRPARRGTDLAQALPGGGGEASGQHGGRVGERRGDGRECVWVQRDAGVDGGSFAALLSARN